MASEVTRFIRRVLSVAAATVLVHGTAWGQTPAADEAELKAAFVLTFLKFVEWPEGQPAEPLVCSADQAVSSALQKAITGPGTTRVRLREQSVAEGFADCSLAYFARLDERKLTERLSAIGAAAVLTVSDAPDFASRGGMIQLYRKDGRMRFAVNTRAAAQARLRLSVRLLTLADEVKGF